MRVVIRAALLFLGLALPVQAHESVYPFTVTRIVDGDTIDGTVDLGFDLTIAVRLRLRCINTPEKYGAERPLGLAATENAKEWLSGTSGEITYFGRGKYGRPLAVYHPGGWSQSYNRRAVEEGFAQLKTYNENDRRYCPSMR